MLPSLFTGVPDEFTKPLGLNALSIAPMSGGAITVVVSGGINPYVPPIVSVVSPVVGAVEAVVSTTGAVSTGAAGLKTSTAGGATAVSGGDITVAVSEGGMTAVVSSGGINPNVPPVVSVGA